MDGDFMTGFVAGQGDNNNCGGGGFFGNEGLWAVIILAILFGWGRNGNGGGYPFGIGGGGSDSGAAANYVLASDFATLQRMISDGNNMIERKLDTQNAGICDLGYTQAQLINNVQANLTAQGYETRFAINGIGQQLAQCCCDIREGIGGVNYNLATQVSGLSREMERSLCDMGYANQSMHAQTMQAIDRVGDRIIDYMSTEKMQTLRDENQALRLAASQQAQNAYLVQQLGQKCPEPAYLVCNPNGPLNYSVNGYSNGGCGCA